MKLRKYATIERDGYFEIYDRDGKKICQCSSIGDAKMMLSLGEGRTLRKINIIQPETVEVSFVEGESDKQLEPQNILPESQQEPLQL